MAINRPLGDKMFNNNSEQLRDLHGKAMNALNLLLHKNDGNADMEVLVKMLLTVWGRFEHDVSIREMMENGEILMNNEIINTELDDYTDIEDCISNIMKVV